MLLTFVRTLVWAADSARLTRQVLRTEAYFRTLVHRAADITIVLDPQEQITWASSAGQGPSAWSARDLEGRRLQDFVHPDDRHELQRALDPAAGLGGRPRTGVPAAVARRGLAAVRDHPDGVVGGPARRVRAREPRRARAAPAGRRRAAQHRARARAHGLHRLPHRPAQPRALHGRARGRPRPRRRGRARLRAAGRPRRLQGGQRRRGPRGRRPAALRGRRNAARRRAGPGPGRPARWRRVRPARARHRRGGHRPRRAARRAAAPHLPRADPRRRGAGVRLPRLRQHRARAAAAG